MNRSSNKLTEYTIKLDNQEIMSAGIGSPKSSDLQIVFHDPVLEENGSVSS